MPDVMQVGSQPSLSLNQPPHWFARAPGAPDQRDPVRQTRAPIARRQVVRVAPALLLPAPARPSPARTARVLPLRAATFRRVRATQSAPARRLPTGCLDIAL